MEGVSFESVRAYLQRAEPYLRPCVYRAIDQALSVSEREEDYEQRDALYELTRECASPFHSNQAAIEAYLSREGGGQAREIVSALIR
jgi:hypothetical protein